MRGRFSTKEQRTAENQGAKTCYVLEILFLDQDKVNEICSLLNFSFDQLIPLITTLLDVREDLAAARFMTCVDINKANALRSLY